MANSANPDQMAPRGDIFSGSTPFEKLLKILDQQYKG